MKIWLATDHAVVACEHCFFGLLRDALSSRNPRPWANERYRAIVQLAKLPWLDQPVRVDARQFEAEIFAAWDELCAVPMNELTLGSATRRDLARGPVEFMTPLHPAGSILVTPQSDATIGELFHVPVGELVGIVAAAVGRSSLRAATHRALVAGSAMHQMWRAVRGGRAEVPVESVGVETR